MSTVPVPSPQSSGVVTVTEWGVRYDEEFVQRVHDETMARKIARAGKSLGHIPVSRIVTVGPWEEAVMPA